MEAKRLTNVQRSFIVKLWYEYDRDNKDKQEETTVIHKVRHVQGRFKEVYERVPTRNTIVAIAKKFEEDGTVENQQKGKSGRVRVVRTPENEKRVLKAITCGASTRNVSLMTGISDTSVRRILKEELQMKPYRPQKVQVLTSLDKERRLGFVTSFLNTFKENPGYLSHIWFSDESYIEIGMPSNSKNDVTWDFEPPYKLQEVKAFRDKICVWCAMSKQGIIGPFFAEDAKGKNIKINKEFYQNMIESYFIPQLKAVTGKSFPHQVFMQDGAPSHTAEETLLVLYTNFGDRVISLKTKNIWPPHSPDLNPCDFYLWKEMKNKVRKINLQNREALKAAIHSAITEMQKEPLGKIFDNFVLRCKCCFSVSGDHFENLLKVVK